MSKRRPAKVNVRKESRRPTNGGLATYRRWGLGRKDEQAHRKFDWPVTVGRCGWLEPSADSVGSYLLVVMKIVQAHLATWE